MGWFFGKVRTASPELEAIKQLSEQNSLLAEQCRVLSEQLTKLSRIQYKQGNEMQMKLDGINESIDSVTKWQETFGDSKQLQMNQEKSKLDQGSQSLIRWLDDLDLFNTSLKEEDQSAWRNMLDNWRNQILALLATLDIQELQLLGTSFDPRVAEAIGTISINEAKANYNLINPQADIPYQIVEITKRGFIYKNGELVRKAQVITLAKENAHAK